MLEIVLGQSVQTLVVVLELRSVALTELVQPSGEAAAQLVEDFVLKSVKVQVTLVDLSLFVLQANQLIARSYHVVSPRLNLRHRGIR